MKMVTENQTYRSILINRMKVPMTTKEMNFPAFKRQRKLPKRGGSGGGEKEEDDKRGSRLTGYLTDSKGNKRGRFWQERK